MNVGRQSTDLSEDSRITLYFQATEIDDEQPEHRGEVVSHSTREFVMCSPIRLDVDTLLSFRMLVPLKVPGNPICETKGCGRVIGERTLLDGTRAYIVRIE